MKDDGREEKRLSHVYSEEQVHAAVSFYTERRKSLSKTIEALGYPHRTRALKGWIEKLAKEELVQRDYGDTRKRYCTEDVAQALCSSQVRGKTSVAEIAKRHGVSRGSIYHMKTKLKDNGYDSNPEYAEVKASFEAAEKELKSVESQIMRIRAQRASYRLVLNALEKHSEQLESFSEDLWISLVDRMVVYSKEDIRLRLKDASEVHC